MGREQRRLAHIPVDTLADPVAGLAQLLRNTGLPCLILPTVCAPGSVFEPCGAGLGRQSAGGATRHVLVHGNLATLLYH